ncbi:hypothetical protein NOVA_21885 [Nocardia nova]|uniref:hypothetical protein n=1 Tax=Nocardia nova TaxID=37330 RepID=UPI001C466166|nr:hypothetical protein [Nocardia nova]MBV7705435.1 hypothetical protein [Nocardia nova]
MGGERFTEFGGLRAVWRMRRRPCGWIEVAAVYDTGVVSGRIVEFAAGTDLVEVRERYPRWNRLWDLVQREFWADLAMAAGCSPVTCRWCGRPAGERP